MSINPADLMPYREQLPQPVRRDLRKQGLVCQETVEIKYANNVRYSSQLPATSAWTYEGDVPGPLIIVDDNQTVHVEWRNTIAAAQTLPYQVVVFPNPAGDALPFQNSPGAAGGDVDDAASSLTASIVTHLHGGLTAADSDGWAENVAPFHHSQFSTYGRANLPDDTRQRATMLWYHDHAVGVTRLNVYAGLFGLWVIRDATEAAAIANGLLPDEDNELFLLIQDRNLATDTDGNLTGAILHKTETSTAEMFGPYTMVNGKLWPTCDVPARPVRFRVLNGSNARTYRLRVLDAAIADDGSVTYTSIDPVSPLPIYQVGTDGGLLDHPVALTEPAAPDGLTLILAPAERADLVVDFSRHSGASLAMVNTVEPDPTSTDPPPEPGDAVPKQRLPFPHVLRFHVGPDVHAAASPLSDPGVTLDPQFRRYVHDAGTGQGHQELVLPKHTHRWIALTENPLGNLLFRELVEHTTDPDVAAATPATTPLIPIAALNGVVTWYRTVARMFHDPVRFFIPHGSWEIWNILNLTGDPHPVHVHLVQFQILSRQPYDISGFQTPPAANPPIPVTPTGLAAPPAANEQGFKDTVRVDPGTVTSIAAKFEGYCGKYMYHCHILEHEDHDMMRPFVVVAPDAFALMPADMGAMTM